MPKIALPHCTNSTGINGALKNLGTSLTSLLGGGKKTTSPNVLPGQPVKQASSSELLGKGISSNTFLLVLLVVGGLLLMLSFGNRGA
jgi:hypothetical protein